MVVSEEDATRQSSVEVDESTSSEQFTSIDKIAKTENSHISQMPKEMKKAVEMLSRNEGH